MAMDFLPPAFFSSVARDSILGKRVKPRMNPSFISNISQ